MMSARDRERQNAARNRRELIAAGFTRRDLVRMGLVTGGGWLIPKNGLSARALRSDSAEFGKTSSPTTTPFSEELSVMPIKQPVPEASLTPAPTAAPNHAGGEGRTRSHQAYDTAHPQKYYTIQQREAFVSISPQLDLQRIWGFDGISPGPTYVSQYGESILVRNVNALPPKELNGGFGLPSVSTHLHNNHGPSESDGNPCDFFGPFEALDDARRGTFYDHHYPNVLAGIYSTHPGVGDINESLSTLWYHDHRVDFTAQNTYKAGRSICCSTISIPATRRRDFVCQASRRSTSAAVQRQVIDQVSGQIFFDLFNLDGILGDKFLSRPRTAEADRVAAALSSGCSTRPSRFYQFHLTDPASPST